MSVIEAAFTEEPAEPEFVADLLEMIEEPLPAAADPGFRATAAKLIGEAAVYAVLGAFVVGAFSFMAL